MKTSAIIVQYELWFTVDLNGDWFVRYYRFVDVGVYRDFHSQDHGVTKTIIDVKNQVNMFKGRTAQPDSV